MYSLVTSAIASKIQHKKKRIKVEKATNRRLKWSIVVASSFWRRCLAPFLHSGSLLVFGNFCICSVTANIAYTHRLRWVRFKTRNISTVRRNAQRHSRGRTGTNTYQFVIIHKIQAYFFLLRKFSACFLVVRVTLFVCVILKLMFSFFIFVFSCIRLLYRVVAPMVCLIDSYNAFSRHWQPIENAHVYRFTTCIHKYLDCERQNFWRNSEKKKTKMCRAFWYESSSHRNWASDSPATRFWAHTFSIGFSLHMVKCFDCDMAHFLMIPWWWFRISCLTHLVCSRYTCSQSGISDIYTYFLERFR